MACRGESTCLCGLETSEASVNAVKLLVQFIHLKGNVKKQN